MQASFHTVKIRGLLQYVYAAPDLGGTQVARARGPQPKGDPYHIHVIMCDMCDICLTFACHLVIFSMERIFLE